jgi:hypothetical protein
MNGHRLAYVRARDERVHEHACVGDLKKKTPYKELSND